MNNIAEVIVDISHENVDRCFEYIIPESLADRISTGSAVFIPFGKGNRLIKGFVTGIKDRSSYDSSKLKEIDSVDEKSTSLESSMIELAAFIRKNYGSTMNKALKIVLPAKKKASKVRHKYVKLACTKEEAAVFIVKYSSGRKSPAKIRLLAELVKEKVLPYQIVRDKLNISQATLRSLEAEGVIKTDIRENLRDVIDIESSQDYDIILNSSQQAVADDIWDRFEKGDRRPALIRGVTGSGKTEIYIELIDRMIKQGKQAIVLIPEIALTYQTVMRFYRKFGDRISVINSRLTYAEKYDQLEKARQGDIDIIIGPRSALFTPFPDLGMIIIDEEHEPAYKNETMPGYHSREVAIKRAQMAGGIVVMGSATPSVETYSNAVCGKYALYELESRAAGAALPDVEIVDMRAELAGGNRSIFSGRLYELIYDRLQKKEQIILFLNRRGHSSFVSCRSCGEAIKCPHCDVSLKYHYNGMLKCHYCGYETPMVKTCPVCGSKYIGTFGTGTQKVEEELFRLFPGVSVLRMDRDTTKEKDGHEKILAAFSDHEADILVGTQMIVKGHDFADVTLVGILAADLSLYSGDYMASERTFQLLTQAAGRAGRGDKPGQVIIQTYSPDNYAVINGARQDYKTFYEVEMEYRDLLGYPPAKNMLEIRISSEDEGFVSGQSALMSLLIRQNADEGITLIGPADAQVAKVNDRYRKVVYIKADEYEKLTKVKDIVEAWLDAGEHKDLDVVFDFSKN